MSAFSEFRTLRAHAGTLSAFSDAMLHLARDLPDRVTLGQMVFFLSAAQGDLQGQPATFGNVRAEMGPVIGKSVQNTYKVFLESPRHLGDRAAEGLGWLTAEVDRSDRRHRLLRLTVKGAEVVEEVCRRLARNSAIPF